MSAIFDALAKNLTATFSGTIPANNKTKLVAAWVKWTTGQSHNSSNVAAELKSASGKFHRIISNATPQSGGNVNVASSATLLVAGAYTEDVWMLTGVYIPADVNGFFSPKVYRDGATDTTSLSSDGTHSEVFETLIIGQGGVLNDFSRWKGKIAEVSVWEPADQTEADAIMAELATVKADVVAGSYAPIWYASLESDATVAVGASLTNNGTTTFDAGDNPLSGDTTAPVLTSPTGSAAGSTTATGGATTDEANGTMYAVVTTSATQPSIAQIKAGQDHTGSAAAFADDQVISSTGAKTFNATGLTASTSYYFHVVHTDAAANNSNRVSSGSFTTAAPDTTAPILSSPSAAAQSNALIVGTVTTDEANGTLYVVATTSATPPSATQIRAGQDHAGAAAVFADDQVIGSTGTKSFNVTGLTELTPYYLYFHHRDASNNDSAVSTANDTTFRDGATGQYILDNTGPVGDNPAGILYNDVDPGDEDNWFSFRITTSPASGTLDIDQYGRFTFEGPEATFFEYQLEVDGVDVGTPQTVELYANTHSATPANSQSGAMVSSTTAVQTHQATPAGATAGATVQSTTAIQVQVASPADSVSGATVQSTTAIQTGTHNAVPADCVGGATVESTLAMQPAIVTPADSIGGATVTSSRAIALSRERAAASAEYPLAGAFREKFEKQPGEMLDYDIKFGRYLDFINDDASDVSPVEGIAEDGLTLVAAHWVPELRSMKVWFNQGASRPKYFRTTFWLNTKGGRRIEADLRVRVKDY